MIKIKIQKKFRHIKAILSALLVTAIAAAALPVTANAAERQIGDVNNDGFTTSLDSFIAQRCSVGLDSLSSDDFVFADCNNDGIITSLDAFIISRYAVELTDTILQVPSKLTLNCGDRSDLNAKFVSQFDFSGVTLTYKTDGAKSTDGSGYTVLQITNNGIVKAFHPGTSVVTVNSSNGFTAKCTVTVKNEAERETITVGSNTLNVTKQMQTYNDAYNTTDDFTKLDGLIVHSTATPGAKASSWYSAWNKPDTNVAVHAFLDDEGVYQYLPYEQIAWHAGSPCNQTYIDFEICEPSGFSYVNNIITGYNVRQQQAYFDKIWTNSTVYAAYLCKTYNLSADDILSHAEAGKMGIATGHADPDHWFTLHGKTMDDFRNDVRTLMKNSISVSGSEALATLPQSSGSSFFEDNPDISPYDMFDVWGDSTHSLK